MAAKQTTQLCYQVNGGTCKNKVSAANFYVCAAGHRVVKDMGRVGASAQLPIEAIHYMDKESRCNLARNPSITHDMAQALFETEDERTRWELAENPSIDRDIQQALFNTKDAKTRYCLAKNPSIDRDIQQALFNTKNKDVWGSLAYNPSIDAGIAELLFMTKNRDVRELLAINRSIGETVIQALFDTGDWRIKTSLARNPRTSERILRALFDQGHHEMKGYVSVNLSISREIAISAALEGYGEGPKSYARSKSIEELAKAENVVLIDEYPETFAVAYIERLLSYPQATDNEMATKALLMYSFTAYKKSEKPRLVAFYRSKILEKYPGDEEIKYLLDDD